MAVPKTALKTSRVLNANLSRMMMATGSVKTAKFVNRLMAPEIMRVAQVEIQYPGSHGVHSFSLGTHVQMMVGIRAIKTTTLSQRRDSCSQCITPLLVSTKMRLTCSTMAVFEPRMITPYRISTRLEYWELLRRSVTARKEFSKLELRYWPQQSVEGAPTTHSIDAYPDPGSPQLLTSQWTQRMSVAITRGSRPPSWKNAVLWPWQRDAGWRRSSTDSDRCWPWRTWNVSENRHLWGYWPHRAVVKEREWRWDPSRESFYEDGVGARRKHRYPINTQSQFLAWSQPLNFMLIQAKEIFKRCLAEEFRTSWHLYTPSDSDL